MVLRSKTAKEKAEDSIYYYINRPKNIIDKIF